MATELTQLTFTVPKDMELLLDSAKKSQFCDCTQSDMILKLITAGLNALNTKAIKKQGGKVS